MCPVWKAHWLLFWKGFSRRNMGDEASLIPQYTDIVLPANTTEVTHLGALAAQCSSLGWVRVLALIVRLFSIFSRAYVASVVQKSNLLGPLRQKIKNNVTLSTLSILEALYELSEIEHGREFSTLLQPLSSVISNKSMESILRTGAKVVSGRLLSKENYTLADELSVKTVLSAIDRILSSTGTQEIDECEPALEALGQIRSSIQGAQFLLSSSPPAARDVIYAAVDRQGRGKQLSIITTETVSEASLSSLLEYFFNSPPELEGNRAISSWLVGNCTKLIKNLTTCLKKKDDDVAKIILEALRKHDYRLQLGEYDLGRD